MVEGKLFRRASLYRVAYIDRLVKEKQYPNSHRLAKELEISRRTVFRYVEFMKDSLNAPLEFCRKHNGYYYTEEDFSLGLVRLSEGELVALFLGHNLLQQCRGTPYEKLIGSAFKKICSLLPDEISIDFGELAQSILFELEPLRGKVEEVAACFAVAGQAMQEHKSLDILYHTLSSDEIKPRTVDPYKLIYHQGAWYLLAYCHIRGQVLTFALDRIKNIALSAQTFTIRDDFSLEDYFKDAFQLFRGEAPRTVKVWFSPRQARYINERIWHPSQEIERQEDGSIILTLTVSGIDRLKRWIMSFGSDARVIAPLDIADDIVDTLLQSLHSYRDSSQ